MTTSIKIKFRKSTVEGKAGTVFYQIIHKRQMARINTDIRVHPHEWNSLCYQTKPLEGILFFVQQRIDQDRVKVKNIIEYCENTGKEYSVQNIVTLYRQPQDKSSPMNNTTTHPTYQTEPSFFSFARNRIEELKAEKRYTTASHYQHTLNSLKHFMGGSELTFHMLTNRLMQKYETWLKNRGLKRNSSSFYLRIVRAIYNRAVQQELAEQTYPFRNVYTGKDKTRKLATTQETIIALNNLNLSGSSHLQLAKDLFIFSFATCGMSFVDMAHLRTSNIRNGYIVYERHKTREPIHLRITPIIERIIKKYERKDSPFIFPLIHGNDSLTNYKQYRSALINYNRQLRTLSSMLPVCVPLTSYVARHSWATIARNQGFPTSFIGKALGHTSERTTQIYLDTLNNEVIDNMNKEVSEMFLKGISPDGR